MTDEIPREYGRRCNDCRKLVVLESTERMLACTCTMWDPNNRHERFPECWE